MLITHTLPILFIQVLFTDLVVTYNHRSNHLDYIALLLPFNRYALVLKYNNLGKMCGECVFPSVNSSSRALTDSCCSCCSQTSNLLHWIWTSRDQQWLVVVLRYAFAEKTNLCLTKSNSIPCCDWLRRELLLRDLYGRDTIMFMLLYGFYSTARH